MSDEPTVKVTDKRMFTPEGELREEYRFLSEKTSDAPAPAGGETGASREPGAAPEAPPEPSAVQGPGADAGGRPLEIPTGGAPDDESRFFDLLSVLAEPVAVYLGDVALPDGQSAENLEMARVHIDLLDVLRRKTMGNLTAQETAVLEDLLYRLRMRYVQKRG